MTDETDLTKLSLPALQSRRNIIKNTYLPEVNQKVAKYKAELQEVDEALLKRMRAEGLKSFTGEDFQTTIAIRNNYPEIEDRTAFEEYVLEKRMLYLLQSRVLMSAIQEEFEAGRPVPGIKMNTKTTISQKKR